MVIDGGIDWMELFVDLVGPHVGFVVEDLPSRLVPKYELLDEERLLVLQIPDPPGVHNVVQVALKVGLDEHDRSSPRLQHLNELASPLPASKPLLDDDCSVNHDVLSRLLEQPIAQLGGRHQELLLLGRED